MPGCRIAAAELGHRPKSEHVEAAICRVDDASDDYEAKKNVKRVVRHFRDDVQKAGIGGRKYAPEMRSPSNARQ